MHRSLRVDLHAEAGHGRAAATFAVEGNSVAVVCGRDYESVGGVGVVHGVLHGVLVRHAFLEAVGRVEQGFCSRGTGNMAGDGVTLLEIKLNRHGQGVEYYHRGITLFSAQPDKLETKRPHAVLTTKSVSHVDLANTVRTQYMA